MPTTCALDREGACFFWQSLPSALFLLPWNKDYPFDWTDVATGDDMLMVSIITVCVTMLALIERTPGATGRLTCLTPSPRPQEACETPCGLFYLMFLLLAA